MYWIFRNVVLTLPECRSGFSARTCCSLLSLFPPGPPHSSHVGRHHCVAAANLRCGRCGRGGLGGGRGGRCTAPRPAGARPHCSGAPGWARHHTLPITMDWAALLTVSWPPLLPSLHSLLHSARSPPIIVGIFLSLAGAAHLLTTPPAHSTASLTKQTN